MARSSGPRVVAELGRPETAGETAARKAASSAAYRASKTFRNLIVALVVTVAIVLVIVFLVPRGSIPERPEVDPVTLAADATEIYGRDVVAPVIPADWRDDDHAWRVNAASIGSTGGAQAWTIVYVPDTTSFLRLSQGFDVDEGWARSTLNGASTSSAISIDGIDWDVFEIRNPDSAGNISYAIGTPAGQDYILLYGTSSAETTAQLASELTDQIRDIQEAS